MFYNKKWDKPKVVMYCQIGGATDMAEFALNGKYGALKNTGLPDEDLGYSEWKAYTMRPMDNLSEVVDRYRKTANVEHLFYDYMDGYFSINNGYLKVTREHDLFTYTDGKWRWKTARELKEGMKLFNFLGEIVNIDSVEWIPGEVEVINFDVEPLDIYFAGGLLVHNKGVDDNPE